MSVQLFPEATEEQRMMADAAIKIMEARCPRSAVRERAEQSGQRHDKQGDDQQGHDQQSVEELWRALGGVGWFLGFKTPGTVTGS